MSGDLEVDLDFDFEGEGATELVLSPIETFARAELSKQKRVTDTQYSVGKPAVDEENLGLVLGAVYQEYTATKGKIPDIRRINSLIGIGAGEVKKILDSSDFKDAITARGINWDGQTLTATQMLVAQILTNPTDKRDLKTKLRSAGVTYPQYRAWMNSPEFGGYMRQITEGMLTDHLPDFNTALTKKALGGDLNAIKYVNELSGRHDPNAQQLLDLQAIVQTLLEIIQRNVKDPETLKLIASEFSLAVNSKPTIRGN